METLIVALSIVLYVIGFYFVSKKIGLIGENNEYNPIAILMVGILTFILWWGILSYRIIQVIYLYVIEMDYWD